MRIMGWADETDEETKLLPRLIFSGDGVLKILTAIVLAASIGISSWALNSVVAHEGRIIRVETRQDGSARRDDEMKHQLDKIAEKLDRLIEKRGNP